MSLPLLSQNERSFPLPLIVAQAPWLLMGVISLMVGCLSQGGCLPAESGWVMGLLLLGLVCRSWTTGRRQPGEGVVLSAFCTGIALLLAFLGAANLLEKCWSLASLDSEPSAAWFHGLFGQGALLMLAVSVNGFVWCPRTKSGKLWGGAFPAVIALTLTFAAGTQHLVAGMKLAPVDGVVHGLLAGYSLLVLWGCRQEMLPSLRFPRLMTVVYTLSLVLIWLCLLVVLTQDYAADFLRYREPFPLTLQLLQHLTALIFVTVSLLLGLYLVGKLDSQMQQTQKMKVMLEHRALVAAMLSHDLKAPIQTQISIIDMLQGQDYVPERIQRMLLAMRETNRFELELVQNLLDWLRFEMTEERFAPERFNLQTLLVEVHRELEPLALYRRQTLLFQSALGADCFVTADYVAIKRVLHNLVINAIQHLCAGRHIQLACTPGATGVIVTVRDDGPGIPQAYQPHLFQRFVGDKEPTSKGLGLYVARKIVERHGGRIWVESPPEGGAQFAFLLPVSEPLPQREASPSPSRRLSPFPV